MTARGGAYGPKIRRGVLLAVAGLAVAPAAGFAWFLVAAAAAPVEPWRHTDGIAVLTGGAERVETGFRLLREGRAGRLIVSGVHPDVTLADLGRLAGRNLEAPAPEAPDLGTSDLGPSGPDTFGPGTSGPGTSGSGPFDPITLGRAATTTRGNAAEIAAWARAAQLRSIRVVTAGYHMPRATLELRRALPEATLLAHPVVPARLREAGAAARLRTWSLLFGEYLTWLGAAVGLGSPAGGAPKP